MNETCGCDEGAHYWKIEAERARALYDVTIEERDAYVQEVERLRAALARLEQAASAVIDDGGGTVGQKDELVAAIWQVRDTASQREDTPEEA